MNHDPLQPGKINMLIADDDPDDQMFFQEALRKIGNSGQVLYFENGKQLLDYLLHNDEFAGPPIELQQSCILLDLNMPRLNGRETLKIIREHPDFKNIPLFVLSTSNFNEDKELCSRLGVTKYFVKPLNLSDLVNIMNEIKYLCSSH